ncbi:MAG: hypothetical protein U1F60_08815 [Planctomycetota bacterium]
MQRLELHDVVRIARLDVADRSYDGTRDCARPPAVGDVGRIVHEAAPGDSRQPLLVECMATPEQTIWLAWFAEHELELVARGVEVGKPRRRSVRRATMWLLAAIAVMVAAWIGLGTIDHRRTLFVLPMVGAFAGLTVFCAALLDLGRALVELPAPTRLQRALGVVLRAPLAMLGLFCVLTAIAVAAYGVYAIASGAAENLKMAVLLPLLFGSFGVRWLQQAFRRQLRVDANEPARTARRR